MHPIREKISKMLFPPPAFLFAFSKMQPEQNILVSCRDTKYYTIKMMVCILNMQILLQFRDFYFPLPTPFLGEN